MQQGRFRASVFAIPRPKKVSVEQDGFFLHEKERIFGDPVWGLARSGIEQPVARATSQKPAGGVTADGISRRIEPAILGNDLRHRSPLLADHSRYVEIDH